MANLEKEDVHHVRTSKINEYKNGFDFTSLLQEDSTSTCDTHQMHMFKEELNKYRSKSIKRRNFYSKTEYLNLIEEIKTAKAKKLNRTADDYYLIRCYDVINCNNREIITEKLEVF